MQLSPRFTLRTAGSTPGPDRRALPAGSHTAARCCRQEGRLANEIVTHIPCGCGKLARLNIPLQLAIVPGKRRSGYNLELGSRTKQIEWGKAVQLTGVCVRKQRADRQQHLRNCERGAPFSLGRAGRDVNPPLAPCCHQNNQTTRRTPPDPFMIMGVRVGPIKSNRIPSGCRDRLHQNC